MSAIAQLGTAGGIGVLIIVLLVAVLFAIGLAAK